MMALTGASLSLEEYARYGRQMIQPGWGLEGQLKLKAARVAVVGAGGLGCPALQYLAGAGVGHLTIIDHDTVSTSNLHRQVLHGGRAGMNKAESSVEALRQLNPHISYSAITEPLLPDTALSLITNHDLILDCTDRPATRYLISDAACALRVPLVSGAGISTLGQWSVYGPPGLRACYRCMWPKAGATQRCDEAGVWGPTVGIVGAAMAADALAVLLGTYTEGLKVMQLGGSPMVRTVKVRPPRDGCKGCALAGAKKLEEAEEYAELCSLVEGDEGFAQGKAGERISAAELKDVLHAGGIVVDTRPPVEFGICSLDGTTNIPLASILKRPEEVPGDGEVTFLCRRGNDSQIAAAALRTIGRQARDVRGGLVAWSRDVDRNFPVY